MTLLAPAGLAALAAWAIPLLIHLARRNEERTTPFAAWRFLQAHPRPRRRPRMDERLLLALRLLLLAVLALWLARPALEAAAAQTPVLAVVPGLPAPPVPAGTRGVWLAPDFPPLDGPAPPGPVAVASLVRELDADLPRGAPLAVTAPTVVEGDAERISLSRPVDWRIVPGTVAPLPARPSAAPVLAVRLGPGAAGARYLAAAARALGHADIAPASAPLPPAGALAWWAAAAVPDSVRAFAERGGTVLLPVSAALPGAADPVWRDPAGASVAEAMPAGRGRLIRFTRPLAPAALPELLDPGFPAHLAALIAPSPVPSRVLAAAYRPEPGGPAPAPTSDRRDLRPPLALLVALLFLAERWIATGPRRSAK